MKGTGDKIAQLAKVPFFHGCHGNITLYLKLDQTNPCTIEVWIFPPRDAIRKTLQAHSNL